MQQFCRRSDNMTFSDNSEDFAQNETVKRKLFSTNDGSGVHLNHDGKEVLKDIFKAVLHTEEETKNKKRNRSDNTMTPQSTEKIDKKSKIKT